MKVKFSNGVVKKCSAPTEQKIFKNVDSEMVGVGWVLILKLTGGVTSTELDAILTTENIASLEFMAESEDDGDISLFSLVGYDKITSSTIRHAEDATATYADIQLSKGV